MNDLAATLMQDAQAVEAAPKDANEQLREEAYRLQELTARKLALTAELTKVNLDINGLQFTTLPELFRRAKTDKFGMPDWPGGAVDLVEQPYCKAVLPSEDQERRDKGLAWLNENAPDLIKTAVTIVLDRDESQHKDALLSLLKPLLRGLGLDTEPEFEQTVHWGTLTSFVREQLDKGRTLPMDILGAQTGRIARIVKR